MNRRWIARLALGVGLAFALVPGPAPAAEHPIGRISAESWARAHVFPAGTPAGELPEGARFGAGSLIVFDFEFAPGFASFCTVNFVFSETGRLAGRIYLGTAGHCIENPGQRFFVCIQDCQIVPASPESAAVGTFLEIGPLAYRLAPIPGDFSLTHDFALIEIPCEYRAFVDPAIPVWGGPSHVATPDEGTVGQLAVFYGWGLGPGQATPERIGVFTQASDPRTFNFQAATGGGDSGAPVLTGVGGEGGSIEGVAAVGILLGYVEDLDGNSGYGNLVQNALDIARPLFGPLELVPQDAEPEFLDTDSDGFLDCEDNCPFVPNPDQADSGGLVTSDPDGIGDVCQCGDVNDDGIVNGNDATLISFACIDVGGLFPGRCAQSQDSPRFVWEKCDVGADPPGRPFTCNGNDGTIVTLAGLGGGPGVRNVCPAYAPILDEPVFDE